MSYRQRPSRLGQKSDGNQVVNAPDLRASGGRFDAFLLPSRVVVPENPLFGGTPGEIMRYGGHGYVAVIRHLPVGEHALHLHIEGTDAGLPPEGVDVDTTLTVTPR